MAYNDTGHIREIFFDFGGVLAEEGFRKGLKEIGRNLGLEPEDFFQRASEAVYSSGYVVGKGSESDFWVAALEGLHTNMSIDEMRSEILGRFVIRPEMLELTRRVRSLGFKAHILSDQTDWLDELDARYHFYGEFDEIFNSYYLGKGKRDHTLFQDILANCDLEPGGALFIDDNEGNVERARRHGWMAILFTDPGHLKQELQVMGIEV